MTIAIIIALLLGGGTSFAAENALPGDVLYPIKVNINEKAQELVAISSEADAKVQAKLAERRLEEAEKLAANGKLNAETSANLSARFEKHSKNSKEHQDNIKDEKNTETVASINSDNEVSLEMHQKLLEDIAETKPEMKGFIDEILDDVRIRLKGVSDDRMEIEAKAFIGEGGDTKASAEGAMKSAQNKIDEVKKFIDSQKDTLNASVKAEVDTQMKVADSVMVEGKTKIESQIYAEAFTLFKKASRLAQSVKLFITNAGALKIELKNHDETDTDEIKNGAQGKEENKVETSNNVELELRAEEDAKINDFPKSGVSGSVKTDINLEL